MRKTDRSVPQVGLVVAPAVGIGRRRLRLVRVGSRHRRRTCSRLAIPSQAKWAAAWPADPTRVKAAGADCAPASAVSAATDRAPALLPGGFDLARTDACAG